MHALKVDYIWDRQAPFLHLYFLGDVHAGAKGCDVDKLMEDLQTIKADKLARVVLMGDLGEFIKRSDKRYDPRAIWPELNAESDIAELQARWIIETLYPIKNKILGAVSGNHEDSIRRHYEHDIHQRVRIGLDAEDLGYYGIIRLSCKRDGAPKDSHDLDVAVHHGYGGGATDSSVALTLHRLLSSYDADICAMGHRHHRIHVEADMQRFVAGKDPYVSGRTRIGICSGTYMNTFVKDVDTYSGRKGFQGVRTGCALVKVKIPEMTMRVEF